MFASKELINYRKKEAKMLQSVIKTKLLQVQKLVIKRLLKGEDITFEISSFARGANIHSIDNIKCGDKYYSILFKHYDSMNYEYDNSICEFYHKQIEIVNYWLKILK